ncbi:LacI family DNA-binding transcriptional regulator [Bifidobacterium eulemuris]|uniref:LacI family DNA-binding transcriptional regulator n=1 Tax=Bifidobacterium eulemuris TaxID=1765219 RepID=A0A261GB53_9BIFI|nr:LacI family DNA-binding transcriptional regulator [Bifidobacterium eulemuris]OZG68661.1 LacI family transcriptional regulator [Bifidobacterium eulemuris]QOL32775.1 LacI family DNA-binding transcriptional regulator [Bifidobacterium eulemuris]
MARTTIDDVAKEAGVSVSTVSRALRGLDKVNPQTRLRVEEAAARLHFSFSKTASSLASGKTMRVAVLLPNEISDWFNANAFEGVYEVLSKEGYDVVPYVMWSEQDLDRFFQTLPGTQNVDAIIVTSFDLDDDKKRVLSELTLPVIGINTPTNDGLDASAAIDDVEAMRAVVRLLHSLGHASVAYVEQPANPSPFVCSDSVRLQGFLDAVDELGYDDDQVMTIPSMRGKDARDMQTAISDLAAQLLSAPSKPTGICVESDRCAVLLRKELDRLGWKIPDEVSLVGFDGDNLGDLAELTTVRQDPVAIGRAAALKALALMKGEALDEPYSVMPTSLVMRSTTARVAPR